MDGWVRAVNTLRNATHVAEAARRFVDAFNAPIRGMLYIILAVSAVDLARCGLRGETAAYSGVLTRSVLDAFFYSCFYTLVQHVFSDCSSVKKAWAQLEARLVLVDDADVLRAYALAPVAALAWAERPVLCALAIVAAPDAIRRIRRLEAAAMTSCDPGEIVVADRHGYVVCGQPNTLDAIIKSDWIAKPVRDDADRAARRGPSRAPRGSCVARLRGATAR